MDFIPCKRNSEMLRDIYFLPEELPRHTLRIAHFEQVYAPFYPNFSSSLFDACLKEFEISSKDWKMDKLSFGQKKKVIIAFGLATQTKILLMDEPTNGLDIPSKSVFRKMMATVANDKQLIIISTHQVRDLHSLIDSVIVLDNGEILLNESNEKITEKLLFQSEEPDTNSEGILYEEENIRGKLVVRENIEQLESKLDIELFFNAVMCNKEKIKGIFNTKS